MHKGRILVVEDEMIVARDLQMTLRGFNFDVPEVVSSGAEAIQSVFKNNPDLVIMDIMIKGSLDGIDAAEIIRSHFDLPVIYLTAYTDQETLRRAKLTESYGFMSKPYDERQLLIAVEFALYKHQMKSRSLEGSRWYENALKEVPAPLLALDSMHAICFINEEAENLLGKKSFQINGLIVYELFNFKNRFIEEDSEYGVSFKKSDNELLTLRIKQKSIRNERGNSQGFILMMELERCQN